MSTTTKKIAITGGIGSGKSYALTVLANAGYFTVSCDSVYGELFNSQSFLRKLKKLFPDCVKGFFKLNADRKKISEQVFSDKQKLETLNALTHPLIIKECLLRMERCKAPVAFCEVPLLFEGGYQTFFDGVIVVVRDKKERIESVKQRSNLTETQIIARMNAQVDYDGMDLSQYTVIPNDGEFNQKVLQVATDLLKDN